MGIGDWFKSYSYKKWHKWVLLFPLLFTTANFLLDRHYELNMASLVYPNMLLDIIVPCSFAFQLYRLSLWLRNLTVLSIAMEYIGKRSITIMFLHTSFLWLTETLLPSLPLHATVLLSIVIAVSLGCIAHDIFNKFKYTRILFLGQR